MNVAVFVANGSEETETVSIVDILRRCPKIAAADIVVVGQDDLLVECSRKVRIIGDIQLKKTNMSGYDAIILPGGMQGAKTFRDNPDVQSAIKVCWNAKKLIAAICAAPIAIKEAGIGKGLKATSHPCVQAQVDDYFEYVTDSSVVVSTDIEGHKLITSQGPGTSILFGLSIIEELVGSDVKNQVKDPLRVPTY